ncbi:hypothetical protein ACHQM5_022963 [Ranunculus cassubicifolius]
MVWHGARWQGIKSVANVALLFLVASVFVSAERNLKQENPIEGESHYTRDVVNFLWQSDVSDYHPIWPEMKFGWRFVVGTIVGFLGAACGTAGGVGGGGIFVPMFSLIVGFDQKSSTALSKCMIFGVTAATVYCNLNVRHPTLEMPIIDYDLALLFQPMLILGISIGVALNVIFADWMVTVLLIVLFIGMSTKAFFRGVETWKKETISKKEASEHLETITCGEEVAYKPLLSGPNGNEDRKVSAFENVYWKELGLLSFVWIATLSLQIAKTNVANCSNAYWVLNLLQVPVAIGVTGYQAIGLYRGRKIIASMGDTHTDWKVHQLIIYCTCGVLAGLVGGLLGLGGGFILGPVFLELGVLPQVTSATATFMMTFSSSIAIVEYYLLNRFPVRYGKKMNLSLCSCFMFRVSFRRKLNMITVSVVVAAIYFAIIAAIAALIGQYGVRKLIRVLGRSSIIIFILAFTIFASAFFLGGAGISNMVGKIQRNEYMGFDKFCKYDGP